MQLTQKVTFTKHNMEGVQMFGKYNFLTHRSMPINVSCNIVFYVFDISLCITFFETMEKK